MPSVEIWIVMDEAGDCEVATDEAIALDRWKLEFGEGFDGLNVTMSEPTGEHGSNWAY